MYCIKCGVKLADSEKQCPLCKTLVFHPEITRENGDPPYPKGKCPAAAPRSLWFQVVISAVFLLPLLIIPLCDIQLNGAVTWSGYATGGLTLSYLIIVLPTWFRKPNPVVFVPCDFVAIGLYLLYINIATGGHWFLSFAFPVTGGIGLIVTTVVSLLKYVPRGALWTLGGASIALGCFMLLMEFLLNLTFHMPKFLGWSLYPLIALVIIGGVLFFFASSRTARETLKRKMFV